jgi:DNA-binding MarR family transcriptional regulator
MTRVRRKAAVSRTAAPRTVSRPELLVHGSDAQFRNLVHDLLTFSYHMETCRDRFGAMIGLTGLQYEILMAVRRYQGEDGGISVGQVAARLRRSGAFITIETNKLVAKGILEKLDDALDRRKVLLRVSQSGRDLGRLLAPVQQQVNDVLFACLDRKGFERLRSLASELVGCGDRATALIDYLSSHPQAGADSRAA